jgi:uncharacterized protein YmfQ (DUF2313 family)
MAVVTLYGRSETLTWATSLPVTFFSDRYLKPAFSLMPSGAVWPRDPDSELYALVRALSHTFARIERRRDELLKEADPRQATEMLLEWEVALGLDGTGFTYAERRDAIVARLRGHLSPTEANIIALTATLGYVVTITTYSGDIFTCVSPCTDQIYTDLWLFVWTVTTPSAGLDDELDALLAAITPQHTLRVMDFT